VLLVNHGTEAFVVKQGDRIAQLVICPVAEGELVEVEALEGTARGGGGYGSTGVG
jgi:dUTP pyrophosphatase